LLERLGIERIDQLLELPRASLSSRFPAGSSGRCLLLERLDQFTGEVDELIVPHRPPPEFEAAWLLEHPTERRDALETIVRQLLERVAETLLARGRGALRLEGRIDCAGGPPLLLQVGLYRPTADARHLMELVGMQLERLALPGAVGRVGIQVTLTAPLAQQQGELFAGTQRDAPRHLAVLVDRLSSRLGRRSVLRPRLQADAQPERACRYQALTGKIRKRSRGRGATPRFAATERPLKLVSPAEAIDAIAVVPDGPPLRFVWQRRGYRVHRHWGPERIETGWWRGRSVKRDYYRVETTDGERYWLFRRLADGRWFLHGVFA
jgi:protein ImuB